MAASINPINGLLILTSSRTELPLPPRPPKVPTTARYPSKTRRFLTLAALPIERQPRCGPMQRPRRLRIGFREREPSVCGSFDKKQGLGKRRGKKSGPVYRLSLHATTARCR
jgi:hypothetical protein